MISPTSVGESVMESEPRAGCPCLCQVRGEGKGVTSYTVYMYVRVTQKRRSTNTLLSLSGSLLNLVTLSTIVKLYQFRSWLFRLEPRTLVKISSL